MNLLETVFKALYWYISTVDKKNEVIFMNYGYHDSKDKVELHEHDEKNRYSIQLYHRLAHKIELQNKHIVEIGCGRGGGIAYITKRFSPESALGIDLNSKAVKFGNKHYQLDALSFEQGDATKLDLPDHSADVIMNVESSHRYNDMQQFLNEVYRILKPGGHFLFTDFRQKNQMNDLHEMIQKFDYEIFDEQIINTNVVEALKMDANRRMDLVERLAPPFLKKYCHDFAGSLNSPTFINIESGDLVYFIMSFKKPE